MSNSNTPSSTLVDRCLFVGGMSLYESWFLAVWSDDSCFLSGWSDDVTVVTGV